MPSQFIAEVAQNQEREAIERLDVRSGFMEKPKYGHDRILFDPENGLFGIFDGVGGDQNPAETATVVRDAFAADEVLKSMHTASNEDEVVSTLNNSFIQARMKVNEVMGREAGYTTATVAKLFTMNETIHIGVASAGDSPLMIRRGGIMHLVNAVPGTGSRISNAIGREGASRTEDDFYVIPLQKGDKIVLCSDGITGDTEAQMLSEEEFGDALDHNDPQTAAERLTKLSKKSDDKSVIVLAVGASAEAPTIREALKAKVSKAAAFVAGLGIAQKVRGIKVEGAREKVRTSAKATGSKINNSARNAAAWTVVKSDSFLAVAKSKETYINFQDRLAKSFNQARDSLTKLYILAGNKITEQRQKTAELSEEERQRRRKIIGGVVGVAVVGAVAYRMWHGMESSGGGHHNFLADILPQDSTDSKEGGNHHHTGSTHHNHHGQGHHTPEHHHGNRHNGPEAKSVPRQLSLDQKGSSIWSTIDHATEQRGGHLTDAQTYDLVSKTLHYNDLSWDDARHLPQGYDFRMPEEVRRAIEETTKKKKVH